MAICHGQRRLWLGRKVSKLHISVCLSDGSRKIEGVFSLWAVGRYPEWPEHQPTVLVAPKLKKKSNNLRTCSMSDSYGMQESTNRQFFHLSLSFLEQSSCKSRDSVPTALPIIQPRWDFSVSGMYHHFSGLRHFAFNCSLCLGHPSQNCSNGWLLLATEVSVLISIL